MSQIFGLTGIILTIYYVFTHHSTTFHGYYDKSAAVLLGFGPPSVMLLSHRISDLLYGMKALLASMFNRHNTAQNQVIAILTFASTAVRTEGLGSVVKIRDQTKNELLRDGFSLIINDFRPEEIRNNLMARINAKQTRMALASNLFLNMSKLCPGMGMIGTLIGLIGMLSNLSDPARLGPSMAMAMVTTLYGLGLGTLIYGPWGEKIAIEAEKVLETDMMIMEGILNIQGKKSFAHIKNLVSAYSNPSSGAHQRRR